MSNAEKKRYPNLGNLSISIVEHFVEPFIGEKALNEIKSPLIDKKIQESLVDALSNTEKRFTNEFEDKELCSAILNLPIADLPSTIYNLRFFYTNPSAPSFNLYLKNRFATDFPNISPERIDNGVSYYISILQEEMTNISEEIRGKLSTLATLKMESHVEQISTSIEALLAFFMAHENRIPSKDTSLAPASVAEPLFTLTKDQTEVGVNAWELRSREKIISIGRAPTNDVVLDAPVVSWNHGYIERVTGNFLFHHQSTTNPTIVRRRGRDYQLTSRKNQMILQNGDRICIGNQTFIVEFEITPNSKGYKTTKKNPTY